jgi:hypothetical protein
MQNLAGRTGLEPGAARKYADVGGGCEQIRASQIDNPAKPRPTEQARPLSADDKLPPRIKLAKALSEAISEATEAGDLKTARVAHEALGKLLNAPGGAEVRKLSNVRKGR